MTGKPVVVEGDPAGGGAAAETGEEVVKMEEDTVLGERTLVAVGELDVVGGGGGGGGGGAELVEDVVTVEGVLVVGGTLDVEGGAIVPDGVVDRPSAPLAVTKVVLAAGMTEASGLDAGGGVPASVV